MKFTIYFLLILKMVHTKFGYDYPCSCQWTTGVALRRTPNHNNRSPEFLRWPKRAAGPILTKLGTKQSWMKGNQNCSNECPFPRGNTCNYEIAKIHWRNSKIFFSRTAGPITTKLGIKHPWAKKLKVLQIRTTLFSKRRFFPFPDQCFDIIIALLICDLSWFLMWAMWFMGLLVLDSMNKSFYFVTF